MAEIVVRFVFEVILEGLLSLLGRLGHADAALSWSLGTRSPADGRLLLDWSIVAVIHPGIAAG
jgi:hypothetical protein